MYDNLNSYRAELTDCEQRTEAIEGLGDVTFIAGNGDIPEINIYPADTQASLEPFLEQHGNYFLISYLGQLPSFSYDYHIDGIAESSILAVEAKDDLFVHLKFDPNADLITGTVSLPVVASALSGINVAQSFSDTSKPKIKTFIVQMLFGSALVNKERVDCIDLVTYVNGQRNLLARSYTDVTVYGTLRKKFRIIPQDSTKIVSCSFGKMDIEPSDNSDTDEREQSMHLSELAQKTGYADIVKMITDMLDTPNKIYNTEVTI